LAALILLAIYSIAMIAVDALYSEELPRQYFGDIGVPPDEKNLVIPQEGVIFFAVNTTLSSFFLGCAGLMTLFVGIVANRLQARQKALFSGQATVFFYMAADDRFMFHEHIAAMSGWHLPSSAILVAVALANVVLYWWLFRLADFNAGMLRLFARAAMLFAAMMLVDVVIPREWPLRLPVEDLLKTWSAFLFLLFAWDAARFRLIGQAGGENGITLPPTLLRYTPARWQAEG
jgi:hypothetical protein